MQVFLVLLNIDTPALDYGYNYGLGYIAALLKAHGHGVSYFVVRDRQADVQALCARAAETKPGIIGFSATTNQFGYVSEIAAALKERSTALTVCGGVHATLEPECLQAAPALDAIVRGEGEYAMLELAEALSSGEPAPAVKSFWFKRGGEIIRHQTRPVIENLDELPFPDKDSLDYQAVLDGCGGYNRFIFSRGCLFRCAYCQNHALADFYGEKYFRSRGPAKAIEEIGRDHERYRFHHIFFDDDLITLDKAWFYEFFEAYKKLFRYPFQCNVRPGMIDADMVKLLKAAGCERGCIGVEHGNEQFRKTVLNRHLSNQQIIDTFRLFEQHGIRNNYAQVMVGLPHENRKLFLDTVRLGRQLHLNNPCWIYAPYPRTVLGELCAAHGWTAPPHKAYRERREAVIDYPGFDRKDIQLCHDLFPWLLRHPKAPLWIPLEWWQIMRRLSSAVRRPLQHLAAAVMPLFRGKQRA